MYVSANHQTFFVFPQSLLQLKHYHLHLLSVQMFVLKEGRCLLVGYCCSCCIALIILPAVQPQCLQRGHS